jgi:hypothetical protein
MSTIQKRIILECDSFNSQKFKQWVLDSKITDNYKLYVITQNSRHQEFKSALEHIEDVYCFTYDYMFKYKSNIIVDQSIYTGFISSLLNNHLTSRLLDRDAFWPKEYGVGVYNAFSYYTFSSYGILGFLKDHLIDMVYFRNTPHKANEWTLGKAAEYLGLDVLITQKYIFPWLFTMTKGLLKDKQVLLEHKPYNVREDLTFHIHKHIEKIKGNYRQAMASYERKRMGKGLFRYYNPFKDKRYILKRPDNFLNKTKVYFYYKKYCEAIDFKNTDYFIFFLHYQPERSTLPEGDEFVDQFYAISVLSRLLPKGMKLVVKEHPAMFTYVCDVRARNLYTYRQIRALDNVILCPLDVDNFELIDNAKAASSITATTTALESYGRQTPFILFGKSLFEAQGIHIYKDIKALQEFINRVCKDEVKINNVEETLVELCLKKSIAGIDLSSREDIDYYQYYDPEEQAHYKLLTEVLQ